jgi:hypothetical protein
LGRFEPNLYEYQFNLDGVLVSDPGNDRPKPQRHVDTSLLLISGDLPDFVTRLNVRHGYTVVPGTHSMFVWRLALSN